MVASLEATMLGLPEVSAEHGYCVCQIEVSENVLCTFDADEDFANDRADHDGGGDA